MLLMSTHNLSFYGALTKYILQLLANAQLDQAISINIVSVKVMSFLNKYAVMSQCDDRLTRRSDKLLPASCEKL